MHSEDARPASHASAGRHGGSAGHAVGSGHEQSTAIVILVGKTVHTLHCRPHAVALHSLEVGISIPDGFFRQAYIHKRYFTGISPVFLEEKREFRQLHAKRAVGLYYGRTVVERIILAHQSRRHINGKHFRFRLVYHLDQSRETSCQGFVQPRAEQAVYHSHVIGYDKRLHLFRYLHKVRFPFVHKPVSVGLAFGRKPLAHVEQYAFHVKSPVRQQPCHSQCIAAVIARPRKHQYLFCIRILSHKVGKSLSSPFHELQRCNLLLH